MYKQDFYLPSTSFCRDMACIRLASWIRPTSKQGCYGVERYGRQLLQEYIVLAAYSVHTWGACGGKLCSASATCCCSHVWQLRVGQGAEADAPHSTNRLSDWDSRGACRASYISSAQQSQPLQLSVVSAESFFNAF